MKTIFRIYVFALFTNLLHAQPGTVNMTPVQSLGLQKTKIEIPAKFVSKVTDTSKLYVNLPVGYKAKLFYAGGLAKPRFMSFDAKGVLYVSDQISSNGKVYALPDADNDGAADTAIMVASGLVYNHDVKFYKGAMYVTESGKVNKFVDADSNGTYETKSTFISGIATGGNHVTRTVVFDAINQKVYLSIGSSCNVCRETTRAIIEEYNEDGTGKRTFANGVRNAVGMALHPATNRLWANNNGSDNQGDNVPPEWTDIVRDGGFYGHPFAYANQVWSNFDVHANYQALKPITAVDSALVVKMVEPAALIQAHSAPMAIQFLNASFPQQFKNGLLMCLRGSWNTPQNYKGYKVVYMDLTNGQDTTVNFVADFCTGFITDTVARTYWGRPVGLATDNNGRIFVSSDESNKFILMIYPTNPPIGLGEKENLEQALVYPNPFSTSFIVSFELNTASNTEVSLFDISGRLVKKIKTDFSAGQQQLKIDATDFENGVYFYELKAGESTKKGKVVCVK